MYKAPNAANADVLMLRQSSAVSKQKISRFYQTFTARSSIDEPV
jgi:hypothetical protein